MSETCEILVGDAVDVRVPEVSVSNAVVDENSPNCEDGCVSTAAEPVQRALSLAATVVSDVDWTTCVVVPTVADVTAIWPDEVSCRAVVVDNSGTADCVYSLDDVCSDCEWDSNADEVDMLNVSDCARALTVKPTVDTSVDSAAVAPVVGFEDDSCVVRYMLEAVSDV